MVITVILGLAPLPVILGLAPLRHRFLKVGGTLDVLLDREAQQFDRCGPAFGNPEGIVASTGSDVSNS